MLTRWATRSLPTSLGLTKWVMPKRSPHCFLALLMSTPTIMSEADAAEPRHDALRARLHLGGIEDSADAGGDAAADVADLVERSVVANLGDGDLGQHREVRKRGSAHVMVQLLA